MKLTERDNDDDSEMDSTKGAASQQPSLALTLNGFVSWVPRRLPTPVISSTAALAVVIRYGEFGTEADGKTRKRGMAMKKRKKQLDDGRQSDYDNSATQTARPKRSRAAFHDLSAKAVIAVMAALSLLHCCPPVALFISLYFNDHLNRR